LHHEQLQIEEDERVKNKKTVVRKNEIIRQPEQKRKKVYFRIIYLID